MEAGQGVGTRQGGLSLPCVSEPPTLWGLGRGSGFSRTSAHLGSLGPPPPEARKGPSAASPSLLGVRPFLLGCPHCLWLLNSRPHT